MKCPVCNAELGDGMKFCPNCGTKMDDNNVIASDLIGKTESNTITVQSEEDAKTKAQQGLEATIQCKIDNASPGDVIEIPCGVYNEKITINKDITLKGSGIEKSIICCGTSDVITIENVQNCKITGFSIKSSDANGEKSDLVKISNLSGETSVIEISDCDLSGGTKYGISCSCKGNINLKNLSIHDNCASGVYVSGGCSLNATNLKCYKNNWHGFQVQNKGSIAKINNCESYENEYQGVYVGNGGKAIVSGGRFHNNKKNGLCAYKDKDDDAGGIIEATDCECYENGTDGSWVFSATFTATNLKCYKNNWHGFQVQNKGSIAELNSCESYENTYQGVYAGNGGKAIVSGGKFHNNKKSGLCADKGKDDVEGGIIEATDCECYENEGNGSWVLSATFTATNIKCYKNNIQGFYVVNSGSIAELNNCESYENKYQGVYAGNGGKTIVSGGRFHNNKYSGLCANKGKDDVAGGIIEAADCECYENEQNGSLVLSSTFTATNVKCYKNNNQGFNVVNSGSIAELNNCESYENTYQGVYAGNGGKAIVSGGSFHNNKRNGLCADKGKDDVEGGIIEATDCECYENEYQGVYECNGGKTIVSSCRLYNKQSGVCAYNE